MRLESVRRRYRRANRWIADRPFVYAVTLSFVIGASWATGSVLIGGDPLPSAVGYGFVAGLSALVAAVLTDPPRSK